MADAFVLAGSVAKGAFAAGVLAELTAPDAARAIGLDLRRIVGASSGALNAVWIAYSVHTGALDASGPTLERIWLDEGTLGRVFALDLRGILGRRGLLGESRVIDLQRRWIKPAPARGEADLRIVVTNLAGELRRVNGHEETTFEHVLHFGAHAFSDADGGLEPMFRAVAASAAFPFVFAPVELHLGGRTVPAVDGGAVNNAPLLQAIAGVPEIDRVFVITPFPRVFTGPVPLRGLGYASHLADVLIEERLFRDLRDADRQTRALHRLAALPIDRATRHSVLEALGWTRRRPLEIIELRPDTPLEGDAFSGFFSRKLREAYVEAGHAAARPVVDALSRGRPAPR